MLYGNKLHPGDSVADLSRNYIVSQKFVKGYVDHLAQIETRKEKRRAESERQQTLLLETRLQRHWMRVIVILTKYRRWKFMSLICI